MSTLVRVSSQPTFLTDTLPRLDVIQFDAAIDEVVRTDIQGVEIIDNAKREAVAAAHPWGATGEELEQFIRKGLIDLIEKGVISRDDIEQPAETVLLDLNKDVVTDPERLKRIIKDGMVATHPDRGGDTDTYQQIEHAQHKNPARAILLAAQALDTEPNTTERDRRYARWYSMYLSGLINQDGSVNVARVDAEQIARIEATKVTCSRFLAPLGFVYHQVSSIKHLEQELHDNRFDTYSGLRVLETTMQQKLNEDTPEEVLALIEKLTGILGPALQRSIQASHNLEYLQDRALSYHEARTVLFTTRSILIDLDAKLVDLLTEGKGDYDIYDVSFVMRSLKNYIKK